MENFGIEDTDFDANRAEMNDFSPGQKGRRGLSKYGKHRNG